jgi:hypothetical protein
MYKFVVVVVFLLGVIGGYFVKNIGNPYQLDYNKIVIDLPITHTHLLENKKYALGEKYLAEDLLKEFNKQGFEVKIYTWEDTYSNKNFGQGFDFIMRGWPELRLPKYHDFVDIDRISVLYETVPYSFEEAKNADIIFTGSLKKDKEYKEKGLNSYFVPQFTRLDKFYPAYKDEYKTKLLFIGNRWNQVLRRKTVDYAVRNNIDIDIYGGGWKDELGEEKQYLIKGEQVLNDELKYYYSSADIVFNDTREDMIEAGFISNRIFDVTASGGFIISDYIKEIEEIYGDSIPMYKTEEEFVELVEYYLAHPEERKIKAQKAHEITVKNYGATEIVKKMTSIMREYAKKYEGKND